MGVGLGCEGNCNGDNATKLLSQAKGDVHYLKDIRQVALQVRVLLVNVNATVVSVMIFNCM